MAARVRVRAYIVGFGDCLLVSLPDGTRKRHMLFDFGRAPNDGGSLQRFPAIARDIQQECAGHLDLLVVTHEHLDHMEGFYRERAVFSQMQVDQVWMGLPSEPDYYEKFPKARLQKRLQTALAGFADDMRRQGISLHPAFASLLANNLSNRDRIAYLRNLGRQTRYLARGAGSTTLDGWGAGIKIHVLAPEQDTSAYYGRSPNAHALRAAVSKFAGHRDAQVQGGQDWEFRSVKRAANGDPSGISESDFAKLRREIQEGGVRAARFIDRAQNNTSLCLMIEAGGKKLLFPGDAELESWEKISEHFGANLGPVDFLKASHHGSRNGTDIALLDALLPKSRASKATVLVSTKCNVYGTRNPVPDRALLDELGTRARVVSTDGLDATYVDIEV